MAPPGDGDHGPDRDSLRGRRPQLNPITLVLGGARSGKSAYAESLCAAFGERIYLATAESVDDEMVQRVERHRARRGDAWVTHETPIGLPAAILAHAAAHRVVLVDCLSVWIGNLMHHERDVLAAGEALAAALQSCRGPVVLVSNEIGSGIVPDNAMARSFRDYVGALHQSIAASADNVTLVTAGLPLALKGQLTIRG